MIVFGDIEGLHWKKNNSILINTDQDNHRIIIDSYGFHLKRIGLYFGLLLLVVYVCLDVCSDDVMIFECD